MTVVCLGTALGPLALATINLALPTIAKALEADAVTLSWMPTGFLLASVIAMLPMGRLADQYGRKRFFFWGVSSTGALSLLASFGQSMEWLLFFRVLQGVSLAMIFSSGMAIVTSIYPAHERGVAVGLYTSSIYFALTLSPAIGGLVTEYLGWRAVFWIQAPIALLVSGLIVLRMPGEWRSPERAAIDWSGSVIFAAAATAFVFGVSGLPGWFSVCLLLLSLIITAVFVVDQNRKEQPLIRIDMFTKTRMLSFSLLTSLLMYSANYPVGFLLSLYLQFALGASPAQAGSILLVQALIMAIVAPLAGRASDRIQPRLVVTAGCLILTVGFLLLVLASPQISYTDVIVSQLLMGVGFGMFSSPNANAAMSIVAISEMGSASAAINLARTIGNLVGMSLLALLIYAYIGERQFEAHLNAELVKTVHVWVIYGVVIGIVAALVSLARGRVKR